MINTDAIKCIKGIQHIGIPSKDIQATIDFYNSLGFETVYTTKNESTGEKVAFLKLENIMIETYESSVINNYNGAIDHIALDVKQIDIIFKEMQSKGYEIIDNRINELPFWEKGIKYFIVKGPNNENIEFCEKID